MKFRKNVKCIVCRRMQKKPLNGHNNLIQKLPDSQVFQLPGEYKVIPEQELYFNTLGHSHNTIQLLLH